MLKKRIAFACLSSLLALSGCKNDEKGEAAEPPRPERPQDVLAHTTAQDVVLSGVASGIMTAYRKAELNQPEGDAGSTIPESVRKDATKYTILFGANNHGEREDCGCRANPLGGLTRRQSLIELASTPEEEAAQKWWGAQRVVPDATLVVDAGDAFFKNVTLSKASPEAQKIAKYDAESVARALTASRLDVFNVGALDMVMGADTFKQLAKTGGFDVVSANLADAESEELLFEPAKLVERDGATFGVIGLTKPEPRVKGYWKDRGLMARPELASYREALSKTTKADFVVLLSNLGIPNTQKLLKELDAKELPDFVVASNSNRLTAQPVWDRGVPIVEPLSRGKHYGRADVFLTGDGEPEYANIEVDPRQAIQKYRRAWTTYANARQRHNKARRDFETLKLESSGSGELDAGSPEAKRMESRRNYLEREIERSQRRVSIAADTVQKTLAELEASESAGDDGGDDYIDVSIIQVKLAVPEARAARKVLDEREARRPEPAGQGHSKHSH